MKNFATFTILGRIARITALNNVTKVTIASNYRRKNKDGAWEDDPHFNEVTIFDANTRRYIDDHCGKGDLVQVEGRLRQNKFERDGQAVYTVDLVCQDFGKLASKAEVSEEDGGR